MTSPPLPRAGAVALWAFLVGFVGYVGTEQSTWYNDAILNDRVYYVTFPWPLVGISVAVLSVECLVLYRLLTWTRFPFGVRMLVALGICISEFIWDPGRGWMDAPPILGATAISQFFLIFWIVMVGIAVSFHWGRQLDKGRGDRVPSSPHT